MTATDLIWDRVSKLILVEQYLPVNPIFVQYLLYPVKPGNKFTIKSYIVYNYYLQCQNLSDEKITVSPSLLKTDFTDCL